MLACPGRRIQELVTIPGSQPVPTWAQEARMDTHGVRSHGVLTLHPVPTHWAQEVGVEAEGFVNLPEDLADISDL